MSESLEKERREVLERAEKIEEVAEQEFAARESAHKKLSEILLKGPEYSEVITVKGIDNKDHKVRVYAIADYAYRQIVDESGISPKLLLDRNEILSHMKFAQCAAAVATKDPDICKVIKPLEAFKILRKTLEISDFPFRAAENVQQDQREPKPGGSS